MAFFLSSLLDYLLAVWQVKAWSILASRGEVELRKSYPSFVHCTENPIYVFPEMKLRGVVPNSYIHVSVSDFPGSVSLFGCS
jgi:hypothetical protein